MWNLDTEHIYTVRTGFLDLRGRGGIQCFTPLSHGEVAQMAERSLSMREVRGSIPCCSKVSFCLFIEFVARGRSLLAAPDTRRQGRSSRAPSPASHQKSFRLPTSTRCAFARCPRHRRRRRTAPIPIGRRRSSSPPCLGLRPLRPLASGSGLLVRKPFYAWLLTSLEGPG